MKKTRRSIHIILFLIPVQLSFTSFNYAIAGTTYIAPSAPMRSNTDSSSLNNINTNFYSAPNSIQIFEAPSQGSLDATPIPSMSGNPNQNAEKINDFNNKKNELIKQNQTNNAKDNDVKNSLHGQINTDTNKNPTINNGHGRIDDFFDTRPVQPTSLDSQFSQKIKVHKLSKTGKVIYHVLDNLGVPMFFSIDSPLDPSLETNYKNDNKNSPQNPALTKRNTRNEPLGNLDSQKITPVTPSINSNQPENSIQAAPVHKKLPASELEGTDNAESNQ